MAKKILKSFSVDERDKLGTVVTTPATIVNTATGAKASSPLSASSTWAKVIAIAQQEAERKRLEEANRKQKEEAAKLVAAVAVNRPVASNQVVTLPGLPTTGTIKDRVVTLPGDPNAKPEVQLLGNTGKSSLPLPDTKQSIFSTSAARKYFEQALQYAQYGPKTTAEMADSLLGFAIGDYKDIGVQDLDWDILRALGIRNETYKDWHRSSGTFDAPEYLTPESITLPSTGYINQSIDSVGAKLAESLKTDEEMKAARDALTTADNWLQSQYQILHNNKGNNDPVEQLKDWTYFDWLSGDRATDYDFGAIMNGTNDMSNEEYDAWVAKLKGNYDAADWNALTNPGVRQYESQTPEIQALHDLLTGESTRRARLEELNAIADASPNYGKPYTPKDVLTPAGRAVYDFLGIEPNSQEQFQSKANFITGWNDYRESVMNNPEDPKSFAGFMGNIEENVRKFMGVGEGAEAISPIVQQYISEALHCMTPDMVEKYKALLYEDPALAEEYLEVTRPERLKIKADYEREYYETRAEDPLYATVDTITSFATQPYSTLNTAIGALTGEADPNAAIYGPSRQVDVTRQTAGELAGKLFPVPIFGEEAGTIAYNIFTSIGDMLVANKIGGIVGGLTGKTDAAQKVMGIVMASESGASTYMSDLQEGKDPLYAATHGIANGLIEAWSESGFIDSLFDEKGKFLSRVWKSTASEAMEEEFSQGMQMGSDLFMSWLTGQKSDIEKTYEYYVQTVGKDKAAMATMQHYANEFAIAGLSGAVSGGGTSAVVNTEAAIANTQYGKEVRKNGDPDRILSIAAGMAEGTESKRIADEITSKQGKGKKPSFYQFGQLTKAIVKDLGEERAAIVNRVQDEAIVDRLVELGEDRTAAKQNASIIRRIARGEKVPRQEMFEAKWSDDATQVVQELTRETKPEDVNRAGNKWVADMESKQLSETSDVIGKQLQVQVATVTPIGKAANRAEEAAKKRVPKRDGKPKLATDSHVTFRATDGSAEISGDFMRFEESDEGMNVVVQTGKGKEGEQKAKLEDWISADGDGVATILSYVGDEQLPHSVTAEEANTLMQVLKHSGSNAKAVIQAFDVNYLAGYSGVDQVGSVLDPALSKIAYENGKRDAEKDEEQRKQRASEYKALENPKAGWLGNVNSRNQLRGLGDEAGLEEHLKALPESQRVAAKIMIESGKALGLNVVLYDSHGKGSENDLPNGAFDELTHTVYYDVSAGAASTQDVQAMKEKGTLGFALMRVGGHELTHYLEVASPEMYAKYKDAIRKAYTSKGVDMSVLIRKRLDKAQEKGQKMTYAQAVAEVVADASEQMLRDSKFTNDLDPTLKGKIKEFIQNFSKKIREIFAHLTGGHEESELLMETVNGVKKYMKGLQELWDAGFEEILAKGTEEPDGETAEAVEGRELKFSPKEIGKENAGEFTEEDGVKALEYCYGLYRARNMSQNHMYIPILGHLDKGLLKRMEAEDYPVIMQVSKGIQAVAPETFAINKSHGHNLSPRVMVDVISSMNEDTYLSVDEFGRYAAIEMLPDDSAMIVFIDIEQDKPPKNVYQFKTGKYNLVVTMYHRNSFEDAEDYLYRHSYTEVYEKKDISDSESSGEIPPSYDATSNDSVPQPDENVNPGLKLSERDLPTDITVRDYLAEMEPTDRMNETEKILLKRYKETMGKLQEAERNAAEQDEIIKTAPFRNPDGSLNDELTKAKNRYQIYRKQADRYARELGRAERNQGFANILATGQKIVGDYLANGSYNRIADATDALETEIKGLGNQLKDIGARLENASQGQRDAFNRGLFNPDELNAAAKQLKESYGSSMTIKAISNRLALAYGEMYADSGAKGAKRFAEAARDLAEDILRTSKYRYHSEALNLIAEEVPTISLTETDEQEIKNAGLTISQYKRGIAPYVRMVEGASDLSSYVTNAQSYGGQLMNILGTDVEGNLAMALYNTIQHEKAEESAGKLEGMNEAASLGVIMADIAGANIPMGGNSDAINYLRNELLKQAGESDTTIKAVEDAIKSAKLATARASEVWRKAVKEVQLSEDAIEYYRAMDEQRRLMELADQKKELTEQLKSKAAEKIHKEVEKQRAEYREREQRAREYRKGREELEKIRKRIGRNVKTINTLRVRETDQKHVPQQLQHVADLVMQTFTDSSLGRLAFPEQKLLSLGRTYRMLQELESDVTYFWDDEIEADIENLQALGEAYSALKNKDGNVPSHLSVEGVAYETEILMGVDHIVANVLNMIDATNDNFLKGRNDTFNEYAFKTGEELRKHKDYKLLRGKAGEIQTMLDETFRTGNMTPIFYFEQLRNQGLKGVFDEIRKGQSKYAKIIAEAKRFEESTKAKYNYGSWVNDGKLKMKTGQGHMIELTREEAAELYAIAKREKANKLYQTEHLLYGGFQYRSVAEKLAEDKTTTVKNTPNQLDESDIAKISNWLTEEQRAYADAMVGYLSNNMAAYGNEASMAMYGYKKFNEQYYIPFNTVADQRYLKGNEGPRGEDAGTGRLVNSGFTNKVQYKANQTLVVSGLTNTVNDHIHKMAAYAAMVEPTENLKRLLNYKVLDEDGTSNTVRALIGQKYGMASENYMTQLLKDINGATQSDKRAMKLVDKMVGAFKRGAVMSSLSVVLQQPTAMARAMAYVSPKYFANNPFYRPSKGTWDEMMKYAGTAVIKDMGKFDVGLGLSATQYIGDEDLSVFEAYKRLKDESKFKAGKAAYDRFMNWLTAAPGVADQWTWGLIWQAVKNEQAALNPGMDQSSEEFLEMCGERFDDVIDHSQVYDSVLTRSDLMRSTSDLHKMATSFMSEPTLSLNMLYHALTGPKGTKRGAIIGGVIASNVLAGALAALVQAWNDDEDKRNWLEKYADKASDNILDNLNPLGMIPYISDIMNMAEGWDVERPDMSVIKDVIDYSKTFFDKAADPDKTLGWKDYENFVGTLVNLLGIPGKNISREIRRSWNAVFNTDWSAPNAFNVGQAIWGDEKAKDYYQRIVTALIRGENELAADYKAYVLASKGADEAKMTEGIRDAYKAAYEKGGIEKETAIQFLLDNGLATGETEAERKKSAFQYVDRWVEGTTNYSAYNTLKEAYKAINFAEIQNAWKELTNNGYTDEQVKSQSRTLLKQLVQDGTLTTGQATQLLKKWCPYKKDSDNTDKPKEWLKNKK